MSLKERIEAAKRRMKDFYEEHRTGCKIAGGLVGTGLSIAIGYLIGKSSSDSDNAEMAVNESSEDYELDLLIEAEEKYEDRMDRLKKEYQGELGFLQGVVECLRVDDGEAYIIAAPGSFYNDEGDDVEVMLLDKEGYYVYADQLEEDNNDES